ncbi:hypothetical protein ACH5RR_027132 [Cinchona calisaya]|uniref:F-box protein GID2 n=1 Tax=Cinchona calisaya TaxID=153742 RepID=A0ABD2Z4M8_9GENT
MKRPVLAGDDEKFMKKKTKIGDSGEAAEEDSEAVLSNDYLLYEVLKHVDARTLAAAACVSKQWSKTAQDERLWELICTEHYTKNPLQLRAVVLALGGFRRLYSLYLWPLLKPSSSSSAASRPVSSAWPCLPPSPPVPAKSSGAGMKTRWGKDEVNLSVSLLSIRYYEKMNFNNRGK